MNPRFFIAVTTISLTTSLHLFSATSSETSSTNNADVIVTRGGKNARIVDILAGYLRDALYD